MDRFDRVVFSARSLHNIDEVIAESIRDSRQLFLLLFRKCGLDNGVDPSLNILRNRSILRIYPCRIETDPPIIGVCARFLRDK